MSDMVRSRAEADARRRECAARDALDDALTGVLLRARARVRADTARTQRTVCVYYVAHTNNNI